MYTQCPTCAALYRVKDEQLEASDRRVRCGMCLAVFDAGRRCADWLPADMQQVVERYGQQSVRALESLTVVDAATADAVPSDALRDEAGHWPEPAPVHGRDPDTTSDFDPDWHLASRLELEAGVARARRGRLGLSGWCWAFGILCLTASLGLQVIWFQRDALAGYPELRPWLERGCALVGCRLPLQRDAARLRMVRSQVTEHPERAGVLVATAVLVNEADFRQPYPLLRLSLLDQNQRVAGERWFHPADYLDDPGLRAHWEAGMPSEHPVSVRLELLDPGSGSAQYRFEYR